MLIDGAARWLHSFRNGFNKFELTPFAYINWDNQTLRWLLLRLITSSVCEWDAV